MSGELTHRGKPVYASTPRALLRDPSISVGAKAVWAILDDHASPDRPVPWPGQDTMAELLGVTDRTIRSWLAELVDAGWIEVQRTGRSNRHVMCWDNDRKPVSGRPEKPDRKPASGRDRKPASGQNGSEVPGKKNHEGAPGEARSESSPTSRARGQGRRRSKLRTGGQAPPSTPPAAAMAASPPGRPPGGRLGDALARLQQRGLVTG